MTASSDRERFKNSVPTPEDRQSGERSLDAYRDVVRQWATGRLPGWARQGTDTSDLVQITLVRAWRHLEKLQGQPELAFRAYLRRILENEIVDRIRSAGRRPARVELADDLPDPTPTPLDLVLEEESLATYQRMLDRLAPRRREALVLRLEGGHPYDEIGRLLGIKSNAARMRVARALVDLSDMIDRNGDGTAQHRPS